MELVDILSGAEPKAPEPAPVEAIPAAPVAAPEIPAERPRGADGKFVGEPKDEPKPEPKAEPKAEPKEPPKEELTAKEKAFLRAAQEERGKRQQIEAELAQLRQAAQPQQPQPQQPQPAFLDDPDGALQRFEAGIDQRINQAVTTTRVQTCEAMARSRHADYDEKVVIFGNMCKDPQYGKTYFQAAMAAPDPAEYVYNTLKQLQERHEWEQAGGAEGMRAKLEKDLRTKWEAEQALKEKEKQALAEALPGSLSEVQGQGMRSAPVWSGPSPLADILKH